MIFATLGNDRRSFVRFANIISRLQEESDMPIFFQHGHTRFVSTSPNVTAVPFIDRKHFSGMLSSSQIVFTHAGAGTLLQCSDLSVIPFVLPRLSMYGEHVNDHQVETLAQFASLGLAIPVEYPAAVKNFSRILATHRDYVLSTGSREKSNKDKFLTKFKQCVLGALSD